MLLVNCIEWKVPSTVTALEIDARLSNTQIVQYKIFLFHLSHFIIYDRSDRSSSLEPELGFIDEQRVCQTYMVS